jgi:hypothetical protein
LGKYVVSGKKLHGVLEKNDLASGNSAVDQESTSGELASTLFSASTIAFAATVLASVAVVSFSSVACLLRRKRRSGKE